MDAEDLEILSQNVDYLEKIEKTAEKAGASLKDTWLMMMVQKNVEKICELEHKSRNLYTIRGKVEEYNAALQEMNDSVPEEFQNKFGMIPLDRPLSEEEYQRYEGVTYNSRVIYKISKYTDFDDEDKEYFLCYVSSSTPIHDTIAACWVYRYEDVTPILHSEYFFEYDEEDELWWHATGSETPDINLFLFPDKSWFISEPQLLCPRHERVYNQW